MPAAKHAGEGRRRRKKGERESLCMRFNREGVEEEQSLTIVKVVEALEWKSEGLAGDVIDELRIFDEFEKSFGRKRFWRILRSGCEFQVQFCVR